MLAEIKYWCFEKEFLFDSFKKHFSKSRKLKIIKYGTGN